MEILGITQARIGSTRLPGKILHTANDKTLLQIHLERAQKSKMVNEWVVATTFEEGVESILEIAQKTNTSYFQGSTQHVLERFYWAAKNLKPTWVVRLTSDCPLIDPQFIDDTIDYCISHNKVYYSNHISPLYVKGLDVEVFAYSLLEEAFMQAKSTFEQEHVTPYMIAKTKFNELIAPTFLYPKTRITLDVPDDLIVIQHLIKELGDNCPSAVYLKYLEKHPEISRINNYLCSLK